MSEDPPSTPARTWFERITQALSGEPQNREELIEELRHAQANGLMSNDTLSMVEGAIEVLGHLLAREPARDGADRTAYHASDRSTRARGLSTATRLVGLP